MARLSFRSFWSFFSQRCRRSDERGRVAKRRAWRFARPLPLSLLALEDRISPAVLTVTNTLDSGPGSLRQALIDSNTSTGVLDTVTFNIPTSDPGYHAGPPAFFTIQPTSALPIISDPVVIDGYSQSGAAPATATSNATLLIELSGATAGVGSNGLTISGGGSTVKGLVINRFGNDGIVLQAGGGNVIAGNYIGTDASGAAALGNTIAGLFITSSPNNLIGGTTAAARNIISGTTSSPTFGRGVWVSGAGSTDNLIQGNYIGTNAAGTAALGNAGDGISLDGGSVRTTVGGTTAGAGNVISGNGRVGVWIPSSNNLIAGNLIGTDASGSVAIGNGTIAALPGVMLDGSSNNTVGGTTAAARNVISANKAQGVLITNGGNNNTVQGNYIGTDANGNTLIPGSVSWWKAEGTAADAVDGNTGILQNGVNFAPGMVGQAFSFDGVNDQVIVPANANLPSGASPRTVEGWIYTRSTSWQPDVNTIFHSGSPALRQSFSLDMDNYPNMQFYSWADDQVFNAGVPLDGWVHIAITYDGGTTVRIYTQGQLRATKTLGGALNTPVTDFEIGTFRAFGASFDGLIDELAVYNRALSATDIQAIVAAGSAGKANDLGNRSHGVQTAGGATSNTIGGPTAASRNVISGNFGDGVNLSGATQAAGTVSWWKANGNTNDSIDGNAGTFQSGAAFTTGLAGGQAFSFTGGNYVQIADNANLRPASLTADGWIKPTFSGRPAAVADIDTVVEKFDGLNGYVLFVAMDPTPGAFLGAPAGGVALGTPGFSLNVGGTLRQIFSPTPIPNDGRFHHVAATYDGTAMRLFVDGVNVTTFAVTGAIVHAAAATPAFIGRENAFPRNSQAAIDEVAVYNRPLSATDIQTIFTAGGPAKGGNVLQNNYIGTDPSGTRDLGNRGSGVQANNSPGHQIGAPGAGNLISGNDLQGVYLVNAGTLGVAVAGNFIGTNAAGTAALGNSGFGGGVYIEAGASFNTIGGTAPGARNVISGNNGINSDGVEIDGNAGPTTGNVVLGNYIGTDVTGTVDLGNRQFGVLVDNAGGNTIGGPTAAARNVISGNDGGFGILINLAGAQNNWVLGNYIGTNAAGSSALANTGSGVQISGGAKNNRIGTDGDGSNDAGERNVISSNTGSGVVISDAGTDNNVVAGNYVGTNAAGSAALGNTGNGVTIQSGAKNNRIGTDGSNDAFNTGERNIISGNINAGVVINGAGTNFNVVAGNFIGTDVLGTIPLANGGNGGLRILGGAQSNRIGTDGNGVADIDERNVISGNTGRGVQIDGAGTNSNVIAGNYIGVNAAGSAALGNTSNGVNIGGTNTNGPQFNRFGTNGDGLSDDLEANVISGNAGAGVRIEGTSTSQNVIAGNYIGTNAAGTAALGNLSDGIIIVGAQGTRVGTDGSNDAFNANERNIISGNSGQGVHVLGNVNYVDNLTAADQLIGGTLPSRTATGTVAQADFRDVTNGITGNWTFDNPIPGGGGDEYAIKVTGTLSVATTGFYSFASSTDDGSRLRIDGTDVIVANLLQTLTNRYGSINLAAGLHTFEWVAFDHTGTAECELSMIAGANVTTPVTAANGWHVVGDANPAPDIQLQPGTSMATTVYYSNAIANNIPTVVAGNYIGTNAAGGAALGNNQNGVLIEGGLQNNRVGTDGNGAADTDERNVIAGNKAAGVVLTGNGTAGNVVAGNYIGTNAAGAAAIPNISDGVQITLGASNNTIGGLTATPGTGAGNVISGNSQRGIGLFGGTSNQIIGNIVGLNAAGTTALPNTFQGVEIGSATSNNTVGGTAAGSRNVISANTGGFGGILIYGPGNTVAGNYIGTDITGTLARGNLSGGVQVIGGSNNLIGGATTAAGNLISGNGVGGILINDAVNFFGLNAPATGNVVSANFVGTDVTGAAPLPNTGFGVSLTGGTKNTVGGIGVADRNVISGNTGEGVYLTGSGTTGNVVAGNYIGTNTTGTAAVANLGDGVRIDGGAHDNTIGGATAAARNVISGNNPVGNFAFAGILITGSNSSGNAVRGNFIGVNAAGSAALGNAGLAGVTISGGAPNTIVGGPAAARNIISGNNTLGLFISGSATGTVVQGNYVGLDVTGSTTVGNGSDGIRLTGGAHDNTIGGPAGLGNVISGNGFGIQIGLAAAGATHNTVQGNLIGTDATGLVALGNGNDGISINTSSNNNTILGNAIAASGQRASSFGQSGIHIYANGGSTPTGTVIQDNFIGTNVNGVGGAAFGNLLDGIRVEGGGTETITGNLIANCVGVGVNLLASSANTIGGTTAATRNVITANSGGGIAISGGADNVISGNNVGVAGNGTTLQPNGTALDVLVGGGSGKVTFDGDLTAGQGGVSVTATAIQVNAGLSTASAPVSFTGPVTFGGTGGITTKRTGSGAGITFNDAVTLNIDTTLTGTTVTFNDSVSGGGNSLTIVGDALFGNAPADTFTGLSSLSVSGSSVVNGAAITSSGGQTYSGAVTLGGDTTLTSTGGGNIAFGAAVNGGFQLTVNTAGTTTFGGAVGSGTALNSLTTDAGGSTVLNGGAATTTGGQTYNDLVTLGANTTLTAGAGGVTFAGPVTVSGVYGLTVNTSGDAVFGAAVGTSVAPLASLTTDTGGQTKLGGNVSAQGNTVTFNDPVVLTTNVTVSDIGDVTFANTVNGGFALTVNTPGVTTFSGAVGGGTALASLTTDAPGTTAINGGSIRTTGTQSFANAVTLGADATLTASSVTFLGTVAGGTHGLTISGNAVFGDAAGDTVTGLTTLAVSGTTAINSGTVSGSGNQTYTGAVTLGTNVTITAGSGNVSFANAVNGGFALSINANGVTTFGGAVGGGTALASLTTDAPGSTAINGGGVTTTGGQTYSDNLSLGASSTLTSTGAGGIQFAGTVNGGFGLAVNTAGTTTFSAAVGGGTALASVTTDAPGATAVNGGAVTTTGAQTYNDPATLAANTTLISTGAGNIAFSSTLNGGFALTVNTSGTTSFGGPVGSGTALTSLTTDAAGSTAVNGGSIKTSVTQVYNDSVTLGTDATLTGTAVTFLGTVGGTTHGLAIVGNVVFGDAAGDTVTGLTTLSVSGTSIVNTGTISGSGDQTYTGPVTLGTNLTISSGAGNVTFTSTVNGAYTLTVNSAGITTFNGEVGGVVPLVKLITDAPGSTVINAPIHTTGDIDFGDAVRIVNNVVFTDLGSTATGITFRASLNGRFSLTLTSSGPVTFFGAVGGVTPLTFLRVNAGGSITDGEPDGQGPPSVTITADQLVLVAGPTAGVGSAQNHLQTRGTLQVKAGTGGIFDVNTGGLAQIDPAFPAFSSPGPIDANFAGGAGNDSFDLSGIATLGADNGKPGGGGFEDEPPTKPTLAQIRISDFSGFNQLNFGSAAGGIRLDLTQADGQTLQDIDGQGHKIVLAGNFQQLIGSSHDDRFTVTPALQQGTDTADRFGLDTQLKSALGDAAGQALYTSVSSLLSGFGATMDTVELAQLLGQFADNSLITSDQLGKLVGSFQTTINTGAGNDRVSAGFLASVNLGSGNNQFTSTIDAALITNVLGGFGALNNVSSADIGTVVGGFRTDVTAGDGNDAARGSFLGTYNLGGGNNLFESTLDDAQLKALGNVLGGFGGKIAEVDNGELTKIVGGFAESATATELVRLVGGFTEAFAGEDLTRVVGGFIDALKNHDQLGGMLGGFGDLAEAVDVGVLLGGFGGKVVEIDSGELTKIVGGFIGTLDLAIQTGITQLFTTYAGNAIQFGQSLANFSALNAEEAATLATLVGGFGTSADDKLDLNKLGEALGGYGGKVAEVVTDELTKIVGGFADILSQEDIIKLMGGFVDGLEAGSGTFDKLGNVLGGFADSADAKDIGLLLGGFGGKAAEVDTGELTKIVGGFISTLDPTVQAGITQLVGGYTGNAIQFGQSLANFSALDAEQAATLITLVGGFGTVSNDALELDKLGQALGGYGGKVAEVTTVDDITKVVGGFIDILDSASITRLVGGFIDGLETDGVALGRVLGGFGQGADAEVMGVVLGGYADNGLNLATLTSAVGGWLSTLDPPQFTMVLGGFGVNSADKIAGKLGSYAGHGADLGNILQGFLGNLDTGEIVTLAQMLGGFTAQGQPDFVTYGQALAAFADGMDDPQRTTLGNMVGGYGEFVTDPQLASLLGGFGVLPPEQVAEVLGGFAETSPPKDLSGALGAFGAKLSEVQLGTVVGGFALDLNQAELTAVVGGFTDDGLTPAQVAQLTTLLGGYTANPPTTTATQLGQFLDTLTQDQLGKVFGGFVEALGAPGLSLLMTGLTSFVITGSGDDVVGGGLLTRFATGAGNDKLFCGPTDPTALTKALESKGLAPAAISHLLDTAGAVLAGGKGNDTYIPVGNFLGHITIKEAFEKGSVDSIDASAFTGGPLVLDLATTAEQTVTKGKLWLTLSDGSGMENSMSSSSADQVWGNDQDNVILGAQPLPAQLAPMVATNAPTQVVYLDFVTGVSTTAYSQTHPQHLYTPAERNAIQARMVTAYQGFNYQFTQAKPSAGQFVTVIFNKTPNNGLPGGQSFDIDFANLNRSGIVVVDVNGFLGGLGQPPVDGDGDASNSIDANLMAMSATIAGHELGHVVGLRHGDSFGPPLSGIHNPPGVNAYAPAFPGPAGALETTWHVMASPLSVGSSLLDAIGQPFFGERELVKLAFADHAPATAQLGTLIVPEQATAAGAHASTATAQPLTLLGLPVPNTMAKGYDANKQFVVTAVDVAGQIKLSGGTSESDCYAFTLPQSQNVTIEVMSTSLTRYQNDPAGTIDSVVRVYDQNGNLIAENDDQFEPQDSNVLDLSLAGGTYYVQVDTFFGSGVPHTDTGKYEMLIYTFAAGNFVDGNDFIDGRGGNDTLNGDRGNDILLGGTGADKLTGDVGNDSFDGGAGVDRLVEVGDVNFKLSDSSLTGLGSDKLTSVEQAILVGGPSANSMDVSTFSGLALLQGLGGNDSLTGGAGGGVMVGGAGDDQLTGAAGDDLMIGGAGADRLTGSAGDDIMVAGATTRDYNPKNPTDYTALLAIHAEWTSSHAVADRMNFILGKAGTGGLNGGFYLVPNGANRTVLDDTNIDTLTGSQGGDWYFVHVNGKLADTITSFGTGDFKQAID